MVKLLRALALTCSALIVFFLLIPESSRAANEFGKLTGIVADPSGTRQMGATVWLSPEIAGGRAVQLLTDQNGVFLSQRLRPGFYSLKATLPGFLPSIQQHISVSANLTTLVRIELDSVFSSLDQLRRQPAQPSEADDWKWVLRASTASRPVLQLRDGTVVITDDDAQDASSTADSRRKQPHTRVEMTTGSSQPGSSSGIPGALGTAVSYDQTLGAAGKLLLAGEMKYDQEPNSIAGGALASMWVPSGEIGRGPETTVVLRQIRFGWDGRSIRAMRFEHSEQVAVGNRLMINYGGQYVTAGLSHTMVSSLRPHAEIAAQLSPHWSAQFLLETDPDSYGLSVRRSLETAIDALQTSPRLLWSGNRPVLAGNWHEEFAVRRTIGSRASIEEAAFHDLSSHRAVYGFQPSSDSLAASNMFPFFSGPYGFDGGADSSWGTRIVYRERLVGNVELAAIYAWAGALAPDGNVKPLSGLEGMLSTRYRHSVATRVAGKVPRVGTQFAASYKWVDGTIVSRQDLFGEAAMAIDPNLSLSIRQPLPSFRTAGHWEALADFRNMLSQGYVSLEGQDGRMLLVPLDRSFRGGVSFQF
jgi:hypothetical protein